MLTVSLEYRGSPGLATNRMANSCWYMMTAALNAGLWGGVLEGKRWWMVHPMPQIPGPRMERMPNDAPHPP